METEPSACCVTLLAMWYVGQFGCWDDGWHSAPVSGNGGAAAVVEAMRRRGRRGDIRRSSQEL